MDSCTRIILKLQRDIIEPGIWNPSEINLHPITRIGRQILESKMYISEKNN